MKADGVSCSVSEAGQMRAYRVKQPHNPVTGNEANMRRGWPSFIVLIAAAVSLAAAARVDYDPVRPYAAFKHGPSAAPDYFPIAVWLQDPSNAAKFRAAGINMYVGLWEGPTEAQLSALKAGKMPVICEQNAVSLKHLNDPTIVGWMHQDEPDNAQPFKDAAGKDQYGPCVPPEHIVDEYRKLRAADPTRPVMLNLGQGVADDSWIGRGAGAKPDDYATYVKGGDIVSFDIYPVASGLRGDGRQNLSFVPKGVDRLRNWAGSERTVWNCIECTRINGDMKPTPEQVRAEVWMSLIHGSRGLIYFVHQFKPKFDEHALLDDPQMLAAVTSINRQIHDLGGVLNSPTIESGAVVTPANPDAQIDILVKRFGKAAYIFSVGLRNNSSDGAFTVAGVQPTARAEVVGESRSIAVVNGKFTDHFEPYQVHIYRITL